MEVHDGCYVAEWQPRSVALQAMSDPMEYPDGPVQENAMRDAIIRSRRARWFRIGMSTSDAT
jgi:hypothetical protein